jgi:endo-1,4-beta-xylanase
MVALVRLAIALSTIVGALAAPTPEAGADIPDFELGSDNLARRQDYTQNYKTGGNVNFQSKSNGYSVTFSGAGDFVVGRGWNKGTNRYVLSPDYYLRYNYTLTSCSQKYHILGEHQC